MQLCVAGAGGAKRKWKGAQTHAAHCFALSQYSWLVQVSWLPQVGGAARRCREATPRAVASDSVSAKLSVGSAWLAPAQAASTASAAAATKPGMVQTTLLALCVASGCVVK